MYKMFGGSAYLFVIIKYFSFAFFCLFLLQHKFFPLWLRHQHWVPTPKGKPYKSVPDVARYGSFSSLLYTLRTLFAAYLD